MRHLYTFHIFIFISLKQIHGLDRAIRLSQGRVSSKTISLGDWVPQFDTGLPTGSSRGSGTDLSRLSKSIEMRCYCAGDAFDRTILQETILKRTQAPSVRAFSEVVRAKHSQLDQSEEKDIMYFDWGSVVICGEHADPASEEIFLQDVVHPCLNRMYPVDRHELDTLRIQYSNSPQTVIKNDELMIHYQYREDEDIILAVGFALAQSVKLRVCEEDLRLFVKKLSRIPESLAEMGEVPVSAAQVMTHVGQLYNMMNDVNLVGAALDLPEDLPSETHIRSLYKAVYDYLEVTERLAVLHDRFAILRDMLELCRSIAQQEHADALEKIIIYALIVCSGLAFVQLVAIGL